MYKLEERKKKLAEPLITINSQASKQTSVERKNAKKNENDHTVRIKKEFRDENKTNLCKQND